MEILTITIDNTQKTNDKKFLHRVVDDIIDSAFANPELFISLSELDMGDTKPNCIRLTLKLRNSARVHDQFDVLMYTIHAMLENLCESDPKIDVIWQETDTFTHTQGAEYMSCVYAVAKSRSLSS